MKRAAGPGRPGGFEESSNRAALLAIAVGSMLALALRILQSRVIFAESMRVRSHARPRGGSCRDFACWDSVDSAARGFAVRGVADKAFAHRAAVGWDFADFGGP